MAEPITTLGFGALAAYLGKDGLQKILGPTADYLGGGLKDFTQKRMEAVGHIFVSAQGKLGNKADTPGEVPPKVLKTVLNEGSYSNDPLAIEYFGGILASARTEGGRDDRSARFAKMVDALSTYQLRAHYLIYATIRKLFSDRGLIFNREARAKMQIFIPFESFAGAMAFDHNELAQADQLVNHIFFGLSADSLIESMQYGPKENIVTAFPKAESSGIVCTPSALGAELFLSAFGLAEQRLEFIFAPELPAGPHDVPDGFPNAVAAQT